jgi:paraquat-inducible protein A
MIACRHCDLLQQEIALPAHSDARCIRCRALLYRGQRTTLDIMLALALGSMAFFIVANLFPIATLSAQGANSSTTLFATALALYDQGRPLVAVLVLATTIAIPALELLALLYLLIPLRAGIVPAGTRIAFRFLLAAHPWSMMEVFMLGILVTLVKLADLATVVPGISLWAFVGLIALFSAITASFSVRDFWRWVDAADSPRPVPRPA